MRPAKGRLVHFHRHDEGERAVRLFDTASAKSKTASLIYETRWVDHGESVLEVQLETGRKHQIRAQLAQVGHPILGDALYGSQRKGWGASARISLCALQLTFEHPISKAAITVCMPPELVPSELRSNS
jgi:23S rRNA pseudouridine1911/1915/1917 synthase